MFEYDPADGPALAEIFEDLASILRQTPEAAERIIAEATQNGTLPTPGQPAAFNVPVVPMRTGSGEPPDDKDLN